MGNKNQKQHDNLSGGQFNSVKIIALMVFIISVGLSLLNDFSSNRIVSMGVAAVSLTIFLLAYFTRKPKLNAIYSHLMNFLVISAILFIVNGTKNLSVFYFYTYSAVIFLLIISAVNAWNFAHHLITAAYFIAGFALLNSINRDYNSFLSKNHLHLLVLTIIVFASIIISLINYILAKKKLSQSSEISDDKLDGKKLISEDVYKSLFENLADGLFRTSIDGKIKLANISFAKLLGYTAIEEIINLDILSDTFVDSSEIEKLLKILTTQKRIKNYRLNLKKKEGTSIIVKLSARLIQDEAGQALFIEGSMQDITLQVAAENERLQQLEELRNEKIKAIKDVNAAVYTSNIKAQFLASMSHEIKTPINSIIGFLTLIEKKMFDSEEELQEFAQNAKTAADSLLDIINNVLDISKIEAGKMELDEVEFNFREEIKKTEAILTPQVTNKNLTLTVEFDDAIPVFVIGDPVRLRQVVLNILSNSVKYTDRGEIILKVSLVKFTQSSVKLKFTIIDTGRGIPKEKLPLIFKPYTQVKQKKWTEKDGSGLGLMITKQFVELMGGEIQLVSEEGIGTTVEFTIFLKIKKSESQVEKSDLVTNKLSTEILNKSEQLNEKVNARPVFEQINKDEIPQPKIFDEVQQAKKSRKRILLVEDNPISQKVEKKLLNDIGYEVEAVSSAFDAIEAIKTNVFDLVLMDIEMPDMDGLTATQKIRNLDAPTNQIPIIAVTAHSSMKDREKCLAAGMDDYIAKPININFMKIIIDQWLNR